MKKGRGFNAYCARYDADDRSTGAEGPPTQRSGRQCATHAHPFDSIDGGDDDDDDDDDDDVGRVAQRCATMRERV